MPASSQSNRPASAAALSMTGCETADPSTTATIRSNKSAPYFMVISTMMMTTTVLTRMAAQSSWRSSLNSVSWLFSPLSLAMMSSSDRDQIIFDEQHHQQRQHIFGEADDDADLERRAAGVGQFLEVDIRAKTDQPEAEDPLHPIAQHLDRGRCRRPALDACRTERFDTREDHHDEEA